MNQDESDYDPAPPDKARGELGKENLPGPAPSRVRFLLTGCLVSAALATLILSRDCRLRVGERPPQKGGRP